MNRVVSNLRPLCRFSRLALLVPLFCGLGLLHLNVSTAAEVVISQVYGGGGNAGAVFRNDFVELFNRGTNAVAVDGWSVQYASAGGTSWQTTPLTGSMNPGVHLLVQLASGGANGQPLPAADVFGTMNLSATAGKVALVRDINVLSGACPSTNTMVDLLGYGTTASCFEGAGPSPAPSASMATFRAADGCADADNNAADFFTSTPAPRSLAAAPAPCAGLLMPRALHEIQGTGAVSPFVGRSVTTTTNVVTALRNNGFFLQALDAEADANPASSEAIFVEAAAVLLASVAVGDAVVVTGFVEEFAPASDPAVPSRTQLINVSLARIAAAQPLPQAILLASSDLQPGGGLEQLERFEAMRLRVASLTVAGATEGFIQEAGAIGISDGLFHGVMAGVARPMREPGISLLDGVPANAPPDVPRFDGNPERLRVDSNAQPGAPRIEVSAGSVIENLTGVLDFEQRAWTLLPDPASGFDVLRSTIPPPFSPTRPDEWMLASFNLQRFFDTVDDPAVDEVVLTPAAFQGRLSKASLNILQRLGAPDILGVVEMENLSTLQILADQLNTDALTAGRTNVNYAAWLEEGTDIGGIDSGFLVNIARVEVLDVLQVGKDATYINPLTGATQLLHDRPPLILRAFVPGAPAAGSLPVTVILNHLRSLSGIDDPSDGARVRAKRRAQAEHVAQLIQERQTQVPPENVIVMGDFNAFAFNDGYVDVMGTIKGNPASASEVVLSSADLVNPDLVLLTDQLPPAERYSYVFDGNAQAIDHILVSTSLCARVTRHGYVRGNTDFPESFRSNFNRPERLSDHDAAVAWFSTSLAQRLLGVTLRADGMVELRLMAEALRHVRIEASVDLQQWGDIGGVTVDDCGRGTFEHSRDGEASARFYRVVAY